MTIKTPFSTHSIQHDAADKLAALRAQLTGTLLTAESIGYDEARKVQNITNDSRPLAIVRAQTSQDVAAAVNFARDNGLALAVRSGGHSFVGHSMVDGALVIDLSAKKSIEIDPVTRIARVAAGCTSGDLAEVVAPYGLALTTGDTSSVGFGGLTTGGGIGFMARKYGLAIDSLLAAEVVTASGEIVTASESEHPDLFWAIRGGGGNFGVVTEFTFRLAQVPQILGGDLVLPATREVIRGYLEYTASAPDELTTIGNLQYAPPLPRVPEELIGQLVFVVIVTWTGDLEEGERALEPLRALAQPLADTVRPMSYKTIYDSTAHQALPHGVALRSMFAHDLSDATLDATIAAMESASSPFSLIQFRGLGGQMARVAPGATAFAHRDKRYLLGLIGVWLDQSEAPEPHRAWVDELWQQVRHEGAGVYVNFLEHDGKERLGDAYPPDTLARLAAIKRTYDPTNLFSLNQNIRPAE